MVITLNNEIGECMVRLSATSDWIGGKLEASHWWSKGQPISQTLIKGIQVRGAPLCVYMLCKCFHNYTACIWWLCVIKHPFVLCFWKNSQKSPSDFECAVRRCMSVNPILGFVELSRLAARASPPGNTSWSCSAWFFDFIWFVGFSRWFMCMI